MEENNTVLYRLRNRCYVGVLDCACGCMPLWVFSSRRRANRYSSGNDDKFRLEHERIKTVTDRPAEYGESHGVRGRRSAYVGEIRWGVQRRGRQRCVR